MIARWVPNPSHSLYVDDFLLTDGGVLVARVEDFGYAVYPCAVNSLTGRLERGGAFSDAVEARLWAERVAGIHPTKPGDERPPFYEPGEEK